MRRPPRRAGRIRDAVVGSVLASRFVGMNVVPDYQDRRNISMSMTALFAIERP